VIVTLAGKTAIVTGAASGIGLAVVQKYLDADANGVIAVDVSEPPESLRRAADSSRLKLGSILGHAERQPPHRPYCLSQGGGELLHQFSQETIRRYIEAQKGQ
jgi:NAD(P)-dependent dehydrogenase (short-subunit alcohol dehydrogenase family)